MFLVPVSRVWCAKLGHKFLVTSFWYQKLGRRTWSCAIHLTVDIHRPIGFHSDKLKSVHFVPSLCLCIFWDWFLGPAAFSKLFRNVFGRFPILGKDAHSQKFFLGGEIYENMYKSTNLVLGKKAA